MSKIELTELAKYEAVAGLKLAAEKHNLNLWGVDAEPIAHIVATRTLNAAFNEGSAVSKEKHDAEVERLKRRVKQFEGWWAGTKTQADQQMQRAQAALSALPDRELAAKLAEQIGVLLLEEEPIAA